MNVWLAQHFFNPAFVVPWGAALVASPIIIHLINRMRFRRVRFAAMEFLLQSRQRNRRRLLLEQLLLLLLRILVVLGLLALIARLILDPSQLSIFRGATVHHLVLLDDSGSMQNRWGETTAFDEAVDVVRKLVAEGERRPNTQKFTLLVLSDLEQPLFSERDVNEAFVKELDVKLENRRCSYRSLDLAAGIDAARKLLSQEKATIKHLHVISDFRSSDWGKQKALGTAVRLSDEADISVNLVKTVPERNANLAITSLTGDVQVAAAGVPLRLKVSVKNLDDRVAEDVPVSVIVDGQKLPRNIVFDKIEAGAEISTEFDVVLDTPKKHQIQVGLPGDALSADNSRFLVVDVPPANDVLIIDGDPAGEEAFFVATALAADAKTTGFSPLIENTEYLRKNSLEKFRCIYMLNVPELPPDAIEPLKVFVAAGGGLAWFLGDAVNATFYTEKLFEKGKGIFPVPLAPVRRDLTRSDETNPGPDLQFKAHPIFELIFKGQDNPFIESVHIDSFLPVAESWDDDGEKREWNRDDNERKDGVSTIATLRNNQPFMFEHSFGEGRVVTCLSSAAPDWNDWARNPSFVLVQLELVKHIVRTDRTLEQRIVGEPIQFDLDPAIYTETVEISSPDSTGERITRLKAAPETGKTSDVKSGNNATGNSVPSAEKDAADRELHLLATFRDTDAPGVYRMKLLDHNQVPEERWISYNVPTSESDLELASNDEIRNRIGQDVQVQIQDPGTIDWIRGKEAGQDVREFLLNLLLFLLIAEQLLAYRLSYHPKTAEKAA